MAASILLISNRTNALLDDVDWFVATQPGLSAGSGTSCDDPDLVVNTSASSSAITSLFQNSVADGDTVVFCPGTYYISETIVIDGGRDVIVLGAGVEDFTSTTILDGKGTTQIMRVIDGASLVLNGFVMKNGSAQGMSVTDNCVEEARCGGALGIMTTGDVAINWMQFESNSATSIGGAIAINGGEGFSVDTGQIETCATAPAFCETARVFISRSLFKDNSAYDGGAIGAFAYNYLEDDVISLIGSNTFSNNTAINMGGAVNSTDSWLNLLNNTIVQSAWTSSGLVNGNIQIRNNILAVEAGTTSSSPAAFTCGEAVDDAGGNLALDSTCGFDTSYDLWNPLNPGVSYVLGDFSHFGLTELQTFGSNSPPMYGITQWSAANGTGTHFASCHTADQRGAVRMAAPDATPGSDVNCDSGAFERLVSWVEPTNAETGGLLTGSGTSDDPYVIPIGDAIELDIPNDVILEEYDPSLDESRSVAHPYTSWSIGDRTITAMVRNQASFLDPFVYSVEYVLPFTTPWNDCADVNDYFCIESASLTVEGTEVGLRHTNDFNVQLNAQFLDGGNGVTSFNWSVGAWNVGASTDLPDEIENGVVEAVIRTGGFAPRMTTSFTKNLQIDVSESGGMHTLTITGSPTEVNFLTGADLGYTACASSGQCGDESTQASYNAVVFSGNSQDLHTWGSGADAFAGFYSAQNAQFGPTISVLALQFRVYPEAYWELTLANPHLAVSGEVATGHMNAWMPSAYFESMGTTTSAALSVGFTVMSEETTDEGTITQVVPAQLSEVNGGLMVTLDSVTYSTNKIRVYNRADTGIQVSSAGGADGSSSNQSTLDFVFRLDRTVTGVSVADFEISETSTTTGCEISAVEVQGVDIHVSVANCSSSGEVAVRLKADSLSFGGNLGPAEAVVSSSVTIDTIRPGVVRFNSSERSPSKKTSLQYVIEFDESVEGLSAGDFVNAGTAMGCVFTPNSSSGTLFTITITGCSNMGTLKPRLITSGVVDSAGNSPLNDWLQTSVVIKLDRVAPQLIFKAVTAKSTKLRTLTFMVAAKSRTEELNCSTITAADFVITKGRFVSVRTQGNKCLVIIASTVATTTTGTTQVAKSRGINITDTAGNRHAGLSGLSLNWTLLR